jgi:hypothetical protein
MVKWASWIVVLWGFAIPSLAYTQTERTPNPVALVDALTHDLCTCVSGIDTQLGQYALGKAVRNCLESAVVRHPTAVRILLRQQTGDGTKGFEIGQRLGMALDQRCPKFKLLRQRIEQLRGRA